MGNCLYKPQCKKCHYIKSACICCKKCGKCTCKYCICKKCVCYNCCCHCCKCDKPVAVVLCGDKEGNDYWCEEHFRELKITFG